MAEVLSQSEIDNLLSGISSTGDVESSEGAEQEQEIIDYDFRRPNRVSKDQLRTLRTIHESFAESFGFFLASKLQTMVNINVISVDQLRYSEFVLSIANPSCIYILEILESDGNAVFELNPQLVLLLVERLLGGNGQVVDEPRMITLIEQKMIHKIIERALIDLRQAWNPISELNFKPVGFESNPDFVQVAPASEIVLIISFEVTIGEFSNLMNICYPSFALEDVIAKLNMQYFSSMVQTQRNTRSYQTISKSLEKTELSMDVELGTSRITIKDLLELKCGDVIRLKKKIDDPLHVKVGEKQKFLAEPGVKDGRKAVLIKGSYIEK
jgi:flagellar motor switch protein FliM